MIDKENATNILKELEKGNNLGERVTLVAAAKTRTPEEINAVVNLGVKDIGENRVNEFRPKYEQVQNARFHFIGHLQTNKVKYLIGKTFLIHSLDRLNLAEEIDVRSQKSDIVTDALMQINIGQETTKGGFLLTEAQSAYQKLCSYKGINIKGLMAMLPYTDDLKRLEKLCKQMREIYDDFRTTEKQFEYLSVGMSADYKIAINCGSNMVRLGSVLFGQRDY